jgi:hypothetical protein
MNVCFFTFLVGQGKVGKKYPKNLDNINNIS